VDADRLKKLLKSVLDYHNFVIQHYFKAEPLDFDTVYQQALRWGQQLQQNITDVTDELHGLQSSGKSLLLEGAQGSLLDIDHGTYPYVTSSNTTAGNAATGTGLGPTDLDYVLGITKAYTTRVGSGPFPTELFDENGKRLAERGVEFGATTGRPRRCGWLDLVALKRANQINGVTGLCITKGHAIPHEHHRLETHHRKTHRSTRPHHLHRPRPQRKHHPPQPVFQIKPFFFCGR